MDIQNLIKMANQIGGYFSSYPDQQEASKEIATHLERFWAPSMRMQLIDHVDYNHGEGLKDVVISSIKLHRDRLAPSRQR